MKSKEKYIRVSYVVEGYGHGHIDLKNEDSVWLLNDKLMDLNCSSYLWRGNKTATILDANHPTDREIAETLVDREKIFMVPRIGWKENVPHMFEIYECASVEETPTAKADLMAVLTAALKSVRTG